MFQFIHTDVAPEKDDLYQLDVIDSIAGSSSGYSRMVTSLLRDKKGSKKGILDTDHSTSVRNKVDKMFDMWLAGEGLKPVTWATLVECLKRSNLHTLAGSIESSYCADVGIDDSHEQQDVEGAKQTLTAHTSQSSMDNGHRVPHELERGEKESPPTERSGSSAATDTKEYVVYTILALVVTAVAVFLGICIQCYRFLGMAKNNYPPLHLIMHAITKTLLTVIIILVRKCGSM